MSNKRIWNWVGFTCMALSYTACNVPHLVQKNETKLAVGSYSGVQGMDSTNTAKRNWKEYFTDPNLSALIDTALQNNQELNITLHEIAILKNEISARQGEYLPFVGLRGGAGLEKAGRYTQVGASEANIEIKPGKETPEPLPDFQLGAYATWEVDIWHKLRNAKKVAATKYLASIEGKNFMVTNLIAEIANSYYELLALDSQLAIVKQNIDLQSNVLRIVRLEKESSKVTELAVKRFEAQVLHTKNLQFDLQQRIVETENRINFLLGRYPQPIARDYQSLEKIAPQLVQAGLPAQLLDNRTDIKRAERELEAAKLDIQVAKANFYPSLGISATLGLQAFNPAYLVNIPKSIASNLVGDLVGPLINKRAIKATYYNANERQIQAVYNYERTVLNAYLEVVNQLSNINNLEGSYTTKSQEVEALVQSVTISNRLFSSARADYMEVLLTQREALESKFDLIETRMKQMNARVNIYRALGGGWN